MALLGNYSVLYKAPGYWRSGGATGQGLDRPNFNGNGPARNRFSVFDVATSHPLGTAPGNAIVIAQKDGGIGSRNDINGAAALTGSGALGRNVAADLIAAASFNALAQLVVSAVATIAGAATVSGNVLAALAAAASLSAQGNVTAAADALAWAVSAIQGQASGSYVPSAKGTLAASIDVAATVDLTAGAIADEILDAQMIETGLSVRETLRLCAAALAGKVSISGNTVTIRNAIADDTDRIVATTNTGGERTAITYDVG